MSATVELGSRVPRRAKAILDRLVGTRTMSPEGMEWLVCATDPFHDSKMRCPGYPDLSTVNSVVQTFTTTTSVSAPTGQAAPWDLHVPFIPVSRPVNQVDSSQDYNGYQRYQSGLITNTSSSIVLWGGYNVIVAGVSGTDWYTTAASAALTNSRVIAIPAKYCSGRFRLLAAAVEAVNTTADLYKGRSITAYKSPGGPEDGTVMWAQQVTVPLSEPAGPLNIRLRPDFPGSSSVDSELEAMIQRRRREKDEVGTPGVFNIFLSTPTKYVNLPPTTQTEAAQYTDSRTWNAEDGCYSIATQCSEENPYQTLKPGEVMIQKTLDNSTVNTEYLTPQARQVWSSFNNGTFIVNPTYGGGQASPLPFNTNGFIMAGLHQSSTIQLTVRYYFERVPATTEADLLSMCQVPPAYDPMALEIYSRCISEMPVGCTQKENPLGEWFMSVLDTIAGVAPRVGKFVSGVGRAIGSAFQGYDRSENIPLIMSNATPQRKMTRAQKREFNTNPKHQKTPKWVNVPERKIHPLKRNRPGKREDRIKRRAAKRKNLRK
jgi:hypothetical protein